MNNKKKPARSLFYRNPDKKHMFFLLGLSHHLAIEVNSFFGLLSSSVTVAEIAELGGPG